MPGLYAYRVLVPRVDHDFAGVVVDASRVPRAAATVWSVCGARPCRASPVTCVVSVYNSTAITVCIPFPLSALLTPRGAPPPRAAARRLETRRSQRPQALYVPRVASAAARRSSTSLRCRASARCVFRYRFAGSAASARAHWSIARSMAARFSSSTRTVSASSSSVRRRASFEIGNRRVVLLIRERCGCDLRRRDRLRADRLEVGARIADRAIQTSPPDSTMERQAGGGELRQRERKTRMRSRAGTARHAPTSLSATRQTRRNPSTDRTGGAESVSAAASATTPRSSSSAVRHAIASGEMRFDGGPLVWRQLVVEILR